MESWFFAGSASRKTLRSLQHFYSTKGRTFFPSTLSAQTTHNNEGKNPSLLCFPSAALFERTCRCGYDCFTFHKPVTLSYRWMHITGKTSVRRKTLSFVTTEIFYPSGLAVISIHRSEALNAINQQLLAELVRCVTEVDGASDVRALIIRSDVPRAFSVGADLKERDEMTPEHARNFVSQLRLCLQHLSDLRVPTISCLHGAVLGGGLELALATDFRVASIRRRPPQQPASPSTILSSSAVDTESIRRSPRTYPREAHESPQFGAHRLPPVKSVGLHEQLCFISTSEHIIDGSSPSMRMPSGYENSLCSTSAFNPENLPNEPSATSEDGKQSGSIEAEECRSSLVVGFPEVSLGILPGAGGTQRLWRVVGFQKSLLLILTAARLRDVQAAEWGLVDVMAGFNEEKIHTLWQTKDSKAEDMNIIEGFTAWVVEEVQRRRQLGASQRKTPGASRSTGLQTCSKGDSFVEGEEEPQEVPLSCSGPQARTGDERAREGSRKTTDHGKNRTMKTADDTLEWECMDAFRVGIGLACRLLRMGPLAVKAAKAAVKRGLDLTVGDGLRCEAEAYDSILHTKDRLEGLKAFKDRRSADFKGE